MTLVPDDLVELVCRQLEEAGCVAVDRLRMRRAIEAHDLGEFYRVIEEPNEGRREKEGGDV